MLRADRRSGSRAFIAQCAESGGTHGVSGWIGKPTIEWRLPRALTDAMAAGGGEAKRVFEAMMTMKKIDIAAIEAARRG
jgi:predicted 3-demethylubiquinone-9 3-methyltransferase (glyoxalase superfamily)